MAHNDKKIGTFIQDQLPGFVLTDAPKLKEFIEKYYEWLESTKVETDTKIPYFSSDVVSFDIVLDDASKKFQGGVLGSFDDAEVVTGSTSGATGVLVKKNLLKYYVVEVSGAFVDSEIITGATSGHTGTISGVTKTTVTIKGNETKTEGKILSDYENIDGLRSFFIEQTTTDATKEAPRGFKVGETLTFSVEPYLDYNPKVVTHTPQLVNANRNFLTLNDVDRTLDDYVDYFMMDMLEAFPRDMSTDTKRIMIKKAKEFYQTKGTEDSFRYLFRTVFNNEELEFYYPKDDILRTSDGVWTVTKKMYIKPASLTIPNINTKYIYGETTGHFGAVENIISVRKGSEDIYEIILNNDSISGTFAINEEIYYMDGTTKVVVGNAFGNLNGITLKNSEQGFEVEKDYYVDKNGNVVEKGDVDVNDQPFLARLHICSGDITDGTISDITIDDGGSGYEKYDVINFDNLNCSDPLIPFRSAKAQVLDVDGGGAITKVRVLFPGKGYIKLPSLTITSTGGAGATLTPIGDNIGIIQKLTIRDPGLKFNLADVELDLNSSSTDNATASFGVIHTDDGKFVGNSGFLSDKKFLIDSLYYQEYSYVLKIGLETKTYKDIVKRLVHPAGLQMFGEISTKTNLDLEMRKNIRKSVLKIIQKLNMQTKNEYEKWLIILSETSTKMKLDGTHGGFLPRLVFPEDIEKSIRVMDSKIQNVENLEQLIVILLDSIEDHGDTVIEEWQWLDYETYPIKYRNLVVDAQQEHLKHTKLSGTISGNQGDLFVTGSGTTFTGDFQDGDYIIFNGKKMLIDMVGDDDTIFLTTSLCENESSEDYLKEENLL